MMSPLPLPDWVPWWVHLAILVAGGLFALLFLLMPFAVFGVKGRLDGIEARLDEIQAEIRSLSLRLPEPAGMDDGYVSPPAERYAARPPIPPATYVPLPPVPAPPPAPPPYAPPPYAPPPAARPGRSEPRLY